MQSLMSGFEKNYFSKIQFNPFWLFHVFFFKLTPFFKFQPVNNTILNSYPTKKEYIKVVLTSTSTKYKEHAILFFNYHKK